MDMITLAMAKAYMDGKNPVSLEVETVLSETTVPVENGSCRIAFAYGLVAGHHTVRVNGEEYEIFYRNGYGYYEGETVYIDLEKDRVAVTFDPHGNHPESVPEYATVSVTAESIHIAYLPGEFLPVFVDLDDCGIGEAIQELISENGGVTYLENVRNFWDRVGDGYSNIFLVTRAQGFVFVIDGISRVFDGGVCGQVGFTIAAALGEVTFAAGVVISPFFGDTTGAKVAVMLL